MMDRTRKNSQPRRLMPHSIRFSPDEKSVVRFTVINLLNNNSALWEALGRMAARCISCFQDGALLRQSVAEYGRPTADITSFKMRGIARRISGW